MTQDTTRLRRSILYMPGTNLRALQKARDLPADAIVIDLEDAVAPAQKITARDQAVAATAAGGYRRREVLIRVNAAGTEWADDDLRAAATSGASGIVLPKVESHATIDAAVRILDTAGAPAGLGIWIMVETPLGVLRLETIVADQPRLQAIVMGTTDLASELRVSPLMPRTGLRHALSHCVLVARAQQIDIIDGVHLTLDDADGLTAACRQGRELGFDGKSLIHPRQIAAANECFGISTADAERARDVLAAWEAAQAAGSGVAVLQGQLIETMHVEDAKRVLALHAASVTTTD